MKNISDFKNYITIFILSSITLLLASCKKDAIKIDEDRTYIEIHPNVVTDLASGSIMLTLKPDGTGGIAPGGDIVYPAKYDISGTKLTVKVDEIDTKFKFTIISDEEIHGQNGEILMLTHN